MSNHTGIRKEKIRKKVGSKAQKKQESRTQGGKQGTKKQENRTHSCALVDCNAECKQKRQGNRRNENEIDTRNKYALIRWCEYMDAYAYPL